MHWRHSDGGSQRFEPVDSAKSAKHGDQRPEGGALSALKIRDSSDRDVCKFRQARLIQVLRDPDSANLVAKRYLTFADCPVAALYWHLSTS
jgi:hypothetical protein